MKLYMKGYEPLKIDWLCFVLAETPGEPLAASGRKHKCREVALHSHAQHTFGGNCRVRAAAGEVETLPPVPNNDK